LWQPVQSLVKTGRILALKSGAATSDGGLSAKATVFKANNATNAIDHVAERCCFMERTTFVIYRY
jgi:hypothetical protein